MSDNINLLFAGDFNPPITKENIYSEELLKVLKDKDFSIVNLETPLTKNLESSKPGVKFKKHPECIKHLKNGFFDAVTLSNNHIRDYGCKGVNDTIETCKKNKILTVGAGINATEAAKPLHLNIKGKSVCILNYSEREYNIAAENLAGANPFDLIDAFYQIKKEKKQNVFVIVVYHGGLEYHNYPLPGIKRKFEFLIDNGADAVISHHTHYISGYSVYKNKPIFYGLGNFYFRYKSMKLIMNNEFHEGLIAKLILSDNDKIQFNIFSVIKSKNQEKLLLNSPENYGLKIEQINKVINSEENLFSYWNHQKDEYKLKYYAIIKFSNRFLAKIIRKLNLKIIMNKKWMKNTLNLIKCDSHKEMIIKSFEDN